MEKSWEKYPELPGAVASHRKELQARKRHKMVRYMLFRLRTEFERSGNLPDTFDDLEIPPGFAEHFLTSKIERVQLPNGQRARIVDGRIRTPAEIGGIATFASRWDVDPDLEVYSRHSTIWQEWNATLQRVVPILGDE